MANINNGFSNGKRAVDVDPTETREWLDSLEYVLRDRGSDRALYLLDQLKSKARRAGINIPSQFNTPYHNTISPEEQQLRPGNHEIEQHIKSLIRWNAMAMVVRANKYESGIGGHISTYASSATLTEVGFNHFFKGTDAPGGGDQIYFQGHASPGVYARAFLEGRLTEQHLANFRREMGKGGGLSSYPHPWLMPTFWQFPTVSMGLGPIMAIYQARYNRYLAHRGLLDTSQCHVWAFLGDGECDEPETLGALTLASREKLNNLTFIVNCNLQRLDGPVRGNGKIIQELEAAFLGAGWNVIKVLWGAEWDPLLAADLHGILRQRMMEVVDGEYQKYSVSPGDKVRKDFFGAYPELLKMVEHLTDEEVQKIRRGGHDSDKVYAAYYQALQHKEQPTVILAKTIKGYGLAGEGKNIAHQQKKMQEEEILKFRDRFRIPISDEEALKLSFYRPPSDSPEIQYMIERRKTLGGFVPQRRNQAKPLQAPDTEEFTEFFKGTEGRSVSTTMAFVRILTRLLSHKEIGRLIVPIVPDEARTFGMEALFRKYGIYASSGQLYEPVDSDQLMFYREARDGQILEEGITEAGSMSSFIAAGTAYSTHGVNTIPFFIYYSMFGFQRIGDLIWAAADMRCKGFLCGGTAGRTTLNGEGLQHQDGHTHLFATAYPNLMTYDPAFAFELAVIIRDGIRRMYQEGEDIFYYLTLQNEDYPMPPMPEGVEDGILKGIYKFKPAEKTSKLKVHLLGSGSILNCALKAQEILSEKYGVSADVWSVTSYKELRRDAMEVTRWNRLHPTQKSRKAYITEIFEKETGPFIAASDYIKLVPDQIAPWVPGGLVSLGTDGFGRSETRANLRRHFEIDAECITLAALHALAEQGKLSHKIVAQAIQELEIDPEKSPAQKS